MRESRMEMHKVTLTMVMTTVIRMVMTLVMTVVRTMEMIMVIRMVMTRMTKKRKIMVRESKINMHKVKWCDGNGDNVDDNGHDTGDNGDDNGVIGDDHLLSRVSRKVEYEDSEERDANTGNDKVHLDIWDQVSFFINIRDVYRVEKSFPSHGEDEGDVCQQLVILGIHLVTNTCYHIIVIL